MPLYRYKNFIPQIPNSCFVAPSGDVIGRVFLGEHVGIWFRTVVRGDVNEIRIGENTNVQDLSMLHVTEKQGLLIGSNVSIGHSVTLHSCIIGNGCLIGMGAIILDGSEIGEGSLVAAGSVVTPNKKFPAKSFIKGSPAKVDRPLTESEYQTYSNHYKSYVVYKNEFKDPTLFELIN